MKNIKDTIAYISFIALLAFGGTPFTPVAHAACDGSWSQIVQFCNDVPDDGDDDDNGGNNDLNVITDSAINIDTDSATLRGEITDLNSNHDYERWFEWGTSSGNLSHDTSHIGTNDTGTFSSTISNLNDDTTYYFRACAEDQDSSDNDCGSIHSFTTDSDNGDDDDDNNSDSDVITTDATNITSNSATLNGIVINESGSQTIHFEWGPTIYLGHSTSSRTVSGDESAVSTTITGLSANQAYFFRIVSNNGDQGAYKSFYTSRAATTTTTTTTHTNTHTETKPEVICTNSGDFMNVDLVASVQEASVGNTVTFTANYENLSGYTLKSVKITADFPDGITVKSTTAGQIVNTNDVELNLSELAPHAKGTFQIVTEINKDANKQTALVSTIEGGHQDPTLVNAYIKATDYSIVRVIKGSMNLSATSFGAGFFPHSLIGWLIIIAIIVLIIVLIRKLQEDKQKKEDSHDHLKIAK